VKRRYMKKHLDDPIFSDRPNEVERERRKEQYRQTTREVPG